MKSLILLFVLVLSSTQSFAAGTKFSAHLANNGTYLLIQMRDDLIPPFEAGELWQAMKGNEQFKTMKEKELTISCEGYTNQTNDTLGNCQIVMPINEFIRVDKELVFKATGDTAARLNRYFIDSAYVTMQRNQVYLSAYNTRNLFFFGITESLIQK